MRTKYRKIQIYQFYSDFVLKICFTSQSKYHLKALKLVFSYCNNYDLRMVNFRAFAIIKEMCFKISENSLSKMSILTQ